MELQENTITSEHRKGQFTLSMWGRRFFLLSKTTLKDSETGEKVHIFSAIVFIFAFSIYLPTK